MVFASQSEFVYTHTLKKAAFIKEINQSGQNEHCTWILHTLLISQKINK